MAKAVSEAEYSGYAAAKPGAQVAQVWFENRIMKLLLHSVYRKVLIISLPTKKALQKSASQL